MKQLDLGCGGAGRKHDGVTEYLGVDIQPTAPHVKKADLAIEPIPFGNDEFDLVTAYDFIEHIPAVIYVPHIVGVPDGENLKDEVRGVERRQCLIELFNEIYRVLKHDGQFYMQTPIRNFSDPTHLSFWELESLNYFSGDYFGWHDHYGHTSRFEKVRAWEENNHVYATLRAVKNLPDDSPYLLKY